MESKMIRFNPPPAFNAFSRFWENRFTDDDIRRIIAIGESFPQIEGVLGDDRIDKNYRDCRVAWIPPAYNEWLTDHMTFIIRRLNAEFFRFDIEGFAECFQYTSYTADHQFYNWHLDSGDLDDPPRKLSMVMMLSDPDDYEGGDLEIKVGEKEQKLTKKKGTVHVFPSWVLHRVTPVTKGVRKSLVVWVTGPRFR